MAGIVFHMTKDIAPRIMVKVELVDEKRWAVRVWIAARLFKLGAKIMNTQIDITGR